MNGEATVAERMHLDVENRTFLGGENFTDSPLFGIEVELEQFDGEISFSSPPLKYWRIDDDGSLRNNGIEFILDKPVKGYDLEQAIHEFVDYIGQCNYVVSKRCSTHVHVDVRDFKWKSLNTLTVLYCMFEKFIFEYVGSRREDNFYCYPVYKSIANKSAIASDLSRGRISSAPKYSSLNIKPVSTFGSVEFRMSDAITDFDSMVEWVMILCKIAKYAKSYEGEASDLLHGHSLEGGEFIFRSVFEELSDCLLSRVPAQERQGVFRDCMRSAQDIIIMQKEHRSNRIKDKLKEDPSIWDRKVIDPDQEIYGVASINEEATNEMGKMFADALQGGIDAQPVRENRVQDDRIDFGDDDEEQI